MSAPINAPHVCTCLIHPLPLLPLPTPPPPRSHSSPTRAVCGAALLQFLLDYPLAPPRLGRHLAWLGTNLGYEHEAGRAQALDLLQQVGRAGVCREGVGEGEGGMLRQVGTGV